MADITANYETGTLGATILTSDTGDATPWGSTAIGANCTLTYDNAHVFTGNLAGKYSVGITTADVYTQWGVAFGTQSGTHYGRAYFYLTAWPAVASALIRCLSTAALAFSIAPNSTGKIQLRNQAGAVVATSTTSLPVNQWVRIEYQAVQGAAGSLEVKMFSSPTSTFVTETVTASGIDILVSTNTFQVGVIVGATVTNFDVWADNVVAAASSYPGPVPVTTGPPAHSVTVMGGGVY